MYTFNFRNILFCSPFFLYSSSCNSNVLIFFISPSSLTTDAVSSRFPPAEGLKKKKCKYYRQKKNYLFKNIHTDKLFVVLIFVFQLCLPFHVFHIHSISF